MSQPFHCIGCGHEHPTKPRGNRCESCGRTTVVDLSALTVTELRQALDAPPAPWRHRLRDVWGAMLVVAVVSGFIGVSATVLQSDIPELPERIQTQLERPSVIFTLPSGDDGAPARAEGWVPLAERYLQVIRERSAQIGPCAEGVPAGSDLLLRFSIDPDGTTTRIDVDRSGDAALAADCVVRAVESWIFTPQPTSGPVRVIVPYVVETSELGTPTLAPPEGLKLVQR